MKSTKLTFKSIKNKEMLNRSVVLFTTYQLNHNLQNYNLWLGLKIISDIRPLNSIKFWYLFLLNKRKPYLMWPEKLERTVNLKSKTKNYSIVFNKNIEIVDTLNYIRTKLMPLVDEDYMSISPLNNGVQTLKLGNCTTTDELYPLVLKTNIAIDNIKLIYNLRICKLYYNAQNVFFVTELLKLPVDMLLRTQKN